MSVEIQNTDSVGMPHVTPLKYWSSLQLDAVSATIGAVFTSWSGAWAMPEAVGATTDTQCVNIGVRNVDSVARECWYPLHERDSAVRAWVQCISGMTGVALSPSVLLRKMLFDEPVKANVLSASYAKADIAGEVVDAAWNDLIASLKIALKISAASPQTLLEESVPASEYRPWNGAVQIELPWSDAMLFLHLNAACVAGIAPERPAAKPVPVGESMVQVAQALENRTLFVSAEMSFVDISIGDLESLRVNDVVIFDHRLDEPIFVKINGGSNLARGFLGKSDGNWAVELDSAAGVQSQPARMKK